MPRKSRIDAPGALHHIMVRGIDRCKIFRDDRDREQYLERLGDVLAESETPCYAWALMPNHWGSKELGLNMTEIAKRLGLTQPAVSIAARRGEQIARQKGYFLLEK